MQVKITKKFVDGVQPLTKDTFFWDETLKGFGLKVTPAGSKIYIVQYRTSGGRRGKLCRFTIGKHGSPWAPDQARNEAQKLLGLVASGNDPAAERSAMKKSITVSELCDQYLLDGVGTKKQSTIDTDRGRINRHILPLLGKMRVKDLSAAHVTKFLKDVADGKTAKIEKTKKRGKAVVKGGKGTATRTVGLLGGILTYAKNAGIIDQNPVTGVKRYSDQKCNRFLSKAEMSKLGEILRTLEDQEVNPAAITIIRLLSVTGARLGEIQNLKWNEFDQKARLLRLMDSKTGQKTLPLNRAAFDLLNHWVRRHSDSNGTYIFASDLTEGPYTGTIKVWKQARKMLGDEKLRLHDLRHSFASFAIEAGASIYVVKELLGHKDIATTQRYTHLEESPIREASDRIGEVVLALSTT